jgi:hypothetical protein
MRTGRDFAAHGDPNRNRQFQRRWTDDPLGLPDLHHLGREVLPKVVEDVGRRAIARWLGKAGQTRGQEASQAFQHADSIRQQLGLDWSELIHEGRAA